MEMISKCPDTQGFWGCWEGFKAQGTDSSASVMQDKQIWSWATGGGCQELPTTLFPWNNLETRGGRSGETCSSERAGSPPQGRQLCSGKGPQCPVSRALVRASSPVQQSSHPGPRAWSAALLLLSYNS